MSSIITTTFFVGADFGSGALVQDRRAKSMGICDARRDIFYCLTNALGGGPWIRRLYFEGSYKSTVDEPQILLFFCEALL